MRYPSVTRWSVWEQGRDLGEERAERRGRAWIVVGRVVRAGVEKVIVSKGRSRARHNIAQRPSDHITSYPRSRPWPPLIVPLTKISDRHIPFDRYDRWSPPPPTFVTVTTLQWPTSEKVLPHDRNKCRRARYTRRAGQTIHQTVT